MSIERALGAVAYLTVGAVCAVAYFVFQDRVRRRSYIEPDELGYVWAGWPIALVIWACVGVVYGLGWLAEGAGEAAATLIERWRGVPPRRH